jgi:hypothetical protein
MEDINNVKIVMLKNGQHIITKINEMFAEGKEESICFLFTAPLIITYKPSSKEGEEFELSFTLWSPFSKSVEFRVPFNEVISIGDPKDDVLENYMEIAGPLFQRLKEINESQQEKTDLNFEEDL